MSTDLAVSVLDQLSPKFIPATVPWREKGLREFEETENLKCCPAVSQCTELRVYWGSGRKKQRHKLCDTLHVRTVDSEEQHEEKDGGQFSQCYYDFKSVDSDWCEIRKIHEKP
ncbi:hypothetical protein BaRGS_00018836 [Batillaria attramentaria]|uniref:Uncharacterized protein n=1 Tax=Batillaria attramentaria TaxID=370345 RepID=A0ABD0KRS1_9CAEN